ncbi:MAG TPA: ferritin-like domain-containing protein [Candidatus Eisenbacteria bacterium]|nr:ferritin-like domain-containing protein [Candidatus Eisenbacteria bacterium]
MDVQKMIEALNKSLSLEYAAVIQYFQHSFLIQGVEREYLSGFFEASGRSSLEHAERLGRKIVALGGLPVVEPGTIRQSTDTNEMLRQALELEREAQGAHHAALKLLGGKEGEAQETALRVMLEELIEAEQNDIDNLEMLLSGKRPNLASKEIRLKQAP